MNLFFIAFEDFKTKFKIYLPYLMMLYVLSGFEIIKEFMLTKNNDTFSFVYNLVNIILTLVVTVFFLRKLKHDSKSGDFWYLLVPFLLYNIVQSLFALVPIFIYAFGVSLFLDRLNHYGFFLSLLNYTLIFLVGLIFLIPAALTYYLPIIATFSNDDKSFIKKSVQIAKKNFKVTFCLTFLSILLEVFQGVLTSVPNTFLRILSMSFYELLSGVLYLILIIVTVKIYYRECPLAST